MGPIKIDKDKIIKNKSRARWELGEAEASIVDSDVEEQAKE